VVDRGRLAEMGIESLRLYGRKVESKEPGVGLGMRYDATALVQALEVVLGKKGGLGWEKSRRNTLEGVGGK